MVFWWSSDIKFYFLTLKKKLVYQSHHNLFISNAVLYVNIYERKT